MPEARSAARLILPLAVFGSSSANSTIRGYLYGAVAASRGPAAPWRARRRRRPPAAGRPPPRPPRRAPRPGLRRPRPRRRPDARRSADSTSNGPIRYPAERITSSSRPSNHRNPSSSRRTRSPVCQHRIARMRRLAEVSAEEGRDRGRVERQLALGRRPALLSRRPRARSPAAACPSTRGAPARPPASRSAGPSRSGRSRRGCRGRSPALKDVHHLRVERLAGRTRRRSDGMRAAGRASARLAIMRYSVGDWHSTVTSCSAAIARRSRGIEAGVVQQGGGAPRPRRDERVARRFRPAAGRGAPRPAPRRAARTSARPVSPGRAGMPCDVHDAARLARGAGREDQRAPGRPAARGGRLARGVGAGETLGIHVVPRRRLFDGRRAPLQLAPCCGPAASTRAGLACAIRRAMSLRAQLLGARQRDRAEPPRAEQREDPLRPCAHQRHHDVAAADAGAGQARRRRGGLCRRLLERVGAHGPVGPHRSQRLVRRPLAGQPLEHVAGEVEAA